MKEKNIAGVLLAGGKSRRMGIDKRMLVVKGETLFNRALSVLVKIFQEIIVVVGQDNFSLKSERVRVVQDVIPNRAAAGGLYTGLLYAESPRVFAVACDMPFLNPVAVKYLVSISDKFDLTLVELRRGLQTMHGIYSKGCLSILEEMVKGENLRLQDLGNEASLLVRKVSESEILPYDPNLLSFMNLNSPADLELARKIKGLS